MSDKTYFSGTTPEGIIHYPHIDQPDTVGKYADGKYKVTLAVTRAGTDFAKLMSYVVGAAKQEWGEAIDMNTVRKPFVNGDAQLLPDGSVDPHSAGKVLLRLKSKEKPVVVGLDRKAIPPTEDPIHAGDYAIASVTACAYVQGGQKGVSFWLGGLMVTRRGQRIGGVNASTLFADAPAAGVVEPSAIVKRTVVHAAKTPDAAPDDMSIF